MWKLKENVPPLQKLNLELKSFIKIAKHLSFQNGDWVQEVSKAPLISLNYSDMPMNVTSIGSLLQLLLFKVMGSNFSHPTDNAIGICVLFSIGVTMEWVITILAADLLVSSVTTKPWILWADNCFEGLYVQCEGNEGKFDMHVGKYPFLPKALSICLHGHWIASARTADTLLLKMSRLCLPFNILRVGTRPRLFYFFEVIMPNPWLPNYSFVHS